MLAHAYLAALPQGRRRGTSPRSTWRPSSSRSPYPRCDGCSGGSSGLIGRTPRPSSPGRAGAAATSNAHDAAIGSAVPSLKPGCSTSPARRTRDPAVPAQQRPSGHARRMPVEGGPAAALSRPGEWVLGARAGPREGRGTAFARAPWVVEPPEARALLDTIRRAGAPLREVAGASRFTELGPAAMKPSW